VVISPPIQFDYNYFFLLGKAKKITYAFGVGVITLKNKTTIVDVQK